MNDCISRQAAIDALKEHYWDSELQKAKDDPCVIDAMTDLDIRTIKALPSVSPARPKGHWKEVYAESDGGNSWIEFQCPHCGDTFGIESGEYGWHYTDPIPWKACPMCGELADMRGDNNG